MIGVLKLDVNTFEEIEHDPNATGQAAIIVALVAIVSAIGGFFGVRAGSAAMQQFGQQFEEFGGEAPFAAFAQVSPVGVAINAFIGAFVAWVVWSLLTYLIGTNLFKGQATMGEMLRVLGFAQLPRLLNLFSFIPCVGVIISLVALVWSLVVGFIAVRQGLDLDNGQTAITVILSWLVALVINACVLGPIFSFIL
jgi:hypothetical protein